MRIMKHLILAIMVYLPLTIFAQESKLNQLFDKYSGQEGYTSVYITSYMFELFAKVSEEADVESVTKGMKGIKILTISDASNAQKESFYNDVINSIKSDAYKDFMIVKDGGQEIKFIVREEGEKITEFVMIVKDPQEPVLLFIEGDIDLAQVAKMSKTMDVKGFEHLEKVEDKK